MIEVKSITINYYCREKRTSSFCEKCSLLAQQRFPKQVALLLKKDQTTKLYERLS